MGYFDFILNTSENSLVSIGTGIIFGMLDSINNNNSLGTTLYAEIETLVLASATGYFTRHDGLLAAAARLPINYGIFRISFTLSKAGYTHWIKHMGWG